MFEQLQDRIHDRNVIILGVGDPMRGDDGFGPALVKRLQNKLQATLIDAGDVPENYLGLIDASPSDTIIVVNAADIGGKPGEAALLQTGQLDTATLTTHNPGLRLFAKVLRSTTRAEVVVLAVQPEMTAFGAPLTPRLNAALERLEQMLVQLLPTRENKSGASRTV
jgi:hydrogenase 3 maturation protease